MKVMITYPPFSGIEGTPLLSQNRQYQVFSEKSVIYPVVPAQAATLLKQAGYEVVWLDCIAEGISYSQFLQIIKEEKPDLIAIEAKTPVIKQEWQIINDLKNLFSGFWHLTSVLFGDHVTALPEESFQNSKVDFILTGGDYDFLLLNLCNFLNQSSSILDTQYSTQSLEPGIWYRNEEGVKDTGQFQLNHDLNSLPFIDRDLTKWRLYAYKNGNYRRRPGTYIMSGRDCWWGKCTFCLLPDTKVFTKNGSLSIKEIVEDCREGENISVMTHTAKFREVVKRFKRYYQGKVLDIEVYNLKQNLQLTPNHKIYAVKRNSLKRCSQRSCWDYLCLPSRISKRLKCDICEKKYYQNYGLEFIEASSLMKGDFVAVPIMRSVKNIRDISVKKILKNNSCFIETDKRIPQEVIDRIIDYYKSGHSQRSITKFLNIDRETVKRYIMLFKSNSLDSKKNPFVEDNSFIKFEQGKKWIPKNIPISKEFMRLVGYYLAEGHVSKMKNRPNSFALALTFSEKEREYINDVVGISKRIFRKVDVRQYKNVRNKTVQININSSILARVFKNLFGDNSYNKRLPYQFLFLSLEKQKELIRGLFSGDGHLRVRSRGEGGSEYIYDTVSSVLAYQLLNILFRQNLIPHFRICSPGKKGTVNKYSISLSQYDIHNIFPEINLPKRSCIFRHGFVLRNYAMIPIKSIKEKKYQGFVYNLEVEGDHSYLANNVAVSNCSWPQLYPNFRQRKVENVLDEIEHLVNSYSVKEIMDDTGTFPTGRWLNDFCQGMIERGLNKKVNLDCNMRFGALSHDQYKLMRKAGFRFLLFGIESANQETLDRINKNVRVEAIIESCRSARRAGLYPHITIMFGYPWESYEDAKKTLDLGRWLLKKDYAYTMQATIVIPYPGTPLFKECESSDLLTSYDWSYYDMKNPVMKLNFNPDQLLKFVQGMYSISFNPEFILRKLLSIREIDDLKYFGRAFLKVMGHILDFKKKRK